VKPDDATVLPGGRARRTAARALGAGHDAVVTQDGPHLGVKVEPTVTPCTQVVLASRATSFPFTAVLNGPESEAAEGLVDNAQVGVYLVYATTPGTPDRPGAVCPPQLDRRPRALPRRGHPRTRSGLRPSRPWRPRCSSGRWMPGGGRLGDWR
jgi:hypothetical protein